jgi:hypothetical protein
MPRPYSNDLRARVIEAIEAGRMPRALLNFEKRALLSMTLSGLRLLGNSVVVYFLFVVRSKRGS